MRVVGETERAGLGESNERWASQLWSSVSSSSCFLFRVNFDDEFK